MRIRRTNQSLSPSRLAKLFNSELEKRKRPPKYVGRTTLYYWIEGEREANYFMLEYLEKNALDRDARQAAADLLIHLDEMAG